MGKNEMLKKLSQFAIFVYFSIDIVLIASNGNEIDFSAYREGGVHHNIQRRCFEYAINSNSRAGDVVVFYLGQMQIIDNNLIASTMSRTHVAIVTACEQCHRRFDEISLGHMKRGKLFVFETSFQSSSTFSMHQIIESLSNETLYDSRGYFIVYLNLNLSRNAHFDNDDKINASAAGNRMHQKSTEIIIRNALTNTFAILWSHKIFNAIVMMCDNISTLSSNCSFFTWFPYDGRAQCGKVINDFVRIDECIMSEATGRLHFHYGAQKNVYFDENDNAQTSSDKRNQNGFHENVNETSGASANDKNIILVGGDRYEFHVIDINNYTKHNFSNETKGKNNLIDCMQMSEAQHNLYNLSAEMKPMLELKKVNETMSWSQRERDRNVELAGKYFVYDYRPFGTIEFRVNDYQSLRSSLSVSMNPTTPKTHHPSQHRWRSSVAFSQRTIANVHRPHFYEKIPYDLHGCAVEAIVIVWPPFVTAKTAQFYGLEHKLILDVSRNMNFHINANSRQMRRTSNSRINSETMKNILMNASCDLAFGNIYPVYDAHKSYDSSIGYLYDQVNWIVPLGAPLPVWMNIFNCFR